MECDRELGRVPHSVRSSRWTRVLLVAALMLMTLSWISGLAPHPQPAQAESCSGGAAGDQVTESPCDGQVGTSVAVSADFKCATGGLPFLTWDGGSIGSGYK